MNTRVTTSLLVFSIIAAIIAGVVAYPLLPEQVASHWNAAGEVDGYMGKFWGTFLLPIVLMGLFLLYIAIPLIDPLRRNIESFRKYYNMFWVAIAVFMLYLFSVTLAWNFGYRFNMATVIVVPIAVLWYLLGILLQKSKRNWFIGIRTPWTLSSDEVWDRTHQLGGKLFKVAGVISLAALLISSGTLTFSVVVGTVLVAALVPVVYSFIIYRKLVR